MLHINPNVYLHLQDYKNSWEKDKIVTITDFLIPEQAEKLNDYLLNVTDDRWQYSIHPFKPNWYTFDNNKENEELIKEGIISANAAYDRGEFCYCFRRFEGYHEDGIKLKELLEGAQFKHLIYQLTDVSVDTIVSVFASMYTGGSALSKHDDTGRGKIAMVYNVTKNWKEEDGGCFHLLHDDWHTVKRKVVPTFNSFTFFYVEGNGQPHYVSKVNEDVTNKRIAFSGWLV